MASAVPVPPPLLIGDVGFLELAVIALVAMFVFGPDKLPELAKQAAGLVRKAREFANNARDQLRTELGPEYADLELRDLDPRSIVRKHIIEAMDDAADDEDDEDDEDEDEEDDDDLANLGSWERNEKLRPGLEPLTEGETPPYDLDAT